MPNRGSLKFTCHFKARSRVEVKAHRFPAPEVVVSVVQYVGPRPTAEELECSGLGVRSSVTTCELSVTI